MLKQKYLPIFFTMRILTHKCEQQLPHEHQDQLNIALPIK